MYFIHIGLIIKYNDKGEIINKICLPINDFLDIFPEEIKEPYFGQIISIMDLRFENGNINIYIGNSINRLCVIKDVNLIEHNKLEMINTKISKKSLIEFETHLKNNEIKKSFLSAYVINPYTNEYYFCINKEKFIVLNNEGNLIKQIMIPKKQSYHYIENNVFISNNGMFYFTTENKEKFKIIELSKDGN